MHFDVDCVDTAKSSPPELPSEHTSTLETNSEVKPAYLPPEGEEGPVPGLKIRIEGMRQRYRIVKLQTTTNLSLAHSCLYDMFYTQKDELALAKCTKDDCKGVQRCSLKDALSASGDFWAPRLSALHALIVRICRVLRDKSEESPFALKFASEKKVLHLFEMERQSRGISTELRAELGLPPLSTGSLASPTNSKARNAGLKNGSASLEWKKKLLAYLMKSSGNSINNSESKEQSRVAAPSAGPEQSSPSLDLKAIKLEFS